MYSVSTQSNNKLTRPGSFFFLQNPAIYQHRLLTDESATEMALGKIPNLKYLCYQLYEAVHLQDHTFTALRCVPVLSEFNSINQAEITRFLQNPTTNHVLIDNEHLKVVLIRWNSGKQSSIHGHPKGGCVFKVLKGRLLEKRYLSEQQEKLLTVNTFNTGNIAYIDDNIAWHSVENPFQAPAISLHVYTKGVNKQSLPKNQAFKMGKKVVN